MIIVRASRAFAAINSFARSNVLLLLLASSVVAAYIPTYLKLIAGPWRTEQEGHGPLIILAAAFVAWQCRGALKNVIILPAPKAGWAILFAGLSMMIVTRALDVLFFEVLSEIPVISGCVILFAGWRVFRIFAFPITFLFFSARLDVGRRHRSPQSLRLGSRDPSPLFFRLSDRAERRHDHDWELSAPGQRRLRGDEFDFRAFRDRYFLRLCN